MSDNIRRINGSDSSTRSQSARVRCRDFIVCLLAIFMFGCEITSPFTYSETPCVPLSTESLEVAETLGEQRNFSHDQPSVTSPERVVACRTGPVVDRIRSPKRVDAGAARIPERLLLVEAQLEQLTRRIGRTDQRIEAWAHQHEQDKQDRAERFAANDAIFRESLSVLKIQMHQLDDSLQELEKNRVETQIVNDRLFDEVIAGLEQITQSQVPAAASSSVSQSVPLEPESARVTEQGSSALPKFHLPP